MNALVELYTETNGPSWGSSDNWLEGTPCSDRWAGVSCCPEEWPHLTAAGECASSCTGSNTTALGARGCGGGAASESTPLDRVTACVVVRLDLAGFGLDGELPESLSSLAYLQELALADNRISGMLPPWLSDTRASQCGGALASLELGGNQLGYDEAAVAKLLDRCRSSGTSCGAGLPPNGCRAFGDKWQVRLERPTTCVDCSVDLRGPLVLLALCVSCFIAALAFYIRLVTRHPQAMRQGISTVSLIFGQLQTLAIIVGNLQLSWPPRVTQIAELASLDFLNNQLIAPECLVASSQAFGSDEGLYFRTQQLRFLVLLTLLVGVATMQKLQKLFSHALAALRRHYARYSGRGSGASLQDDDDEAVPPLQPACQSCQSSATMEHEAGEATPDACNAAAAFAAATSNSREGTAATPGTGRDGRLVRFCSRAVGRPESTPQHPAPSSPRPAGSACLTAISPGEAAPSVAESSVGAAALKRFTMLRGLSSLSSSAAEEHVAQQARQRRADTLEMVHTLVFQVQLVMAWRYSLAIVSYHPEQSLGARTAVALGLVLLAVNALYLVKYFVHVRALVYGAPGCGPVARLDEERLSRRLVYLTRRFASHAPFWQFVVWGRQLLLLIDAFLPRWYEPFAVVGSARQDLAYRGVVITHSAVALAIFFVFWALHARIRPYAYEFQNRIESGLFACNIVTVVLGLAYTFETERRRWIEALLLSVLGASWLATASYLGLVYYRETRHGDAPKEADAVELPTALSFFTGPHGGRGGRCAGSSQLSFDTRAKGPTPQQLADAAVEASLPSEAAPGYWATVAEESDGRTGAGAGAGAGGSGRGVFARRSRGQVGPAAPSLGIPPQEVERCSLLSDQEGSSAAEQSGDDSAADEEMQPGLILANVRRAAAQEAAQAPRRTSLVSDHV